MKKLNLQNFLIHPYYYISFKIHFIYKCITNKIFISVYFILFYFILFYFILFYFILFYSDFIYIIYIIYHCFWKI